MGCGMADQGLIQRQVQGAALVLSLNRPPVNALNTEMMAALSLALTEAADDPAIAAVVLAAEGPHFSPGADVGELGRVQGAGLPKLTADIEAMPKPVVACVAGNCLGAAAELILACHGRVAHEGARIGFPEVSLGLVPVAGSTQRLPRLLGAPITLQLLTSGAPVRAMEALAMGLLDAVVEDKPLARAVALALELAGKPLVKTSDCTKGLRDPVAFQAVIAEARKAHEGWRLPAPVAVIACVEAALLLPFDLGLTFEQAQAETMAESAEAAGLRHAFLAQRRAMLPPAGLAAAMPAPLSAVTVLGTAGMVPEVVQMALGAGLRVRLVAGDRDSLGAALTRIAARHEALVAEGRLSPAAREADWARLTGSTGAEGEGPADLVLIAADAPGQIPASGPPVALGREGPIALYPASGAGGLAQLAIAPGVPLPHQALALAFGRKLGWQVLVQGPGAAIDQRLRLALARAIAALEHTRQADRAQIAAVLAAHGLGAGTRPKLPPAPEGGAEIRDFCLAAVMNEAAVIVSESVAHRPSDVDAAALLSGLFPRWEGGPMFQADRIGAMALRADLRRRALRHPQIFTPAAVFDLLLAEGQSFADLNR